MRMIRKHRGQATVELALVFPVFLVLFFSIFDLGRAFHCWSTLNHMCVEAARIACKRRFVNVATTMFTPTTHTSGTVVTSTFWKYASPLTPVDRFTLLPFVGVDASNDAVTIKATFQFEPWTPGVGALLGVTLGRENITFSASVNQKKE